MAGMPPYEPVRRAGRIVRSGGIVAYPTEGVFGLGCLPDDMAAVARILRIKRRDPDMGLLLIASCIEQLAPWVDLPCPAPALESSVDRPVTWIVPASTAVPYWIRGKQSGVGVRITAHEIAAALCDAAGSALVSTSANFSGQPATRNRYVLRRRFRDLVDCIVPGDCGPAAGPSEIRVLGSKRIVRAAKR
jgi:L-threonylcarbamoyladenylate synthase